MTEALYIGGGSVGDFMPTSLAALGAAEAALALPLIDIQAKIAGAIAASASISIQPPSLELAAAIEGALQLPGVAIDVTAMASLLASLNVDRGTLQLALSLILAIKLGFGTAGVHAYELQGEIGGMGSALQGQLGSGMPGGSGPSQLGTAVVLLAGDNGSIAAIQALFAL